MSNISSNIFVVSIENGLCFWQGEKNGFMYNFENAEKFISADLALQVINKHHLEDAFIEEYTPDGKYVGAHGVEAGFIIRG